MPRRALWSSIRTIRRSLPPPSSQPAPRYRQYARRHARYERSVHLDSVERELPQERQRGVTRSEVVDEDSDAEIAEPAQHVQRVGARGQRLLGDFESKPAAQGPRLLESFLH